jgi:ketosteroid isomerase-like protein
MTTQQVADRLVGLCREKKYVQALDELYSPEIVSTEPRGDANMPAEMKGIEAIRAKTQWWFDTYQQNEQKVDGPLVADTHFAVRFYMDTTHKQSGQRMKMTELAVYEVKDGKIVSERFFYSPG